MSRQSDYPEEEKRDANLRKLRSKGELAKVDASLDESVGELTKEDAVAQNLSEFGEFGGRPVGAMVLVQNGAIDHPTYAFPPE